jgi:hypothetical protein
MNRHSQKTTRRLAIVPNSRGFGFAVVEGESRLVHWGLKGVGTSNPNVLEKARALVRLYTPQVLVIEDYCRRVTRIQELGYALVAMSNELGLALRVIDEKHVRRASVGSERGTNQALAENIAQQFPAELNASIPRKRKAWTSEDPRMAVFKAVALAVVAAQK